MGTKWLSQEMELEWKTTFETEFCVQNRGKDRVGNTVSNSRKYPPLATATKLTARLIRPGSAEKKRTGLHDMDVTHGAFYSYILQDVQQCDKGLFDFEKLPLKLERKK